MTPAAGACVSVYWHRDLPPLDAEPVGEFGIDAVSARAPDTMAGREALWTRGEEDLMAETRRRLACEIERLRGRYAHVIAESIEVRHDGATAEAWLHGRFKYVLYR